jgi:hypothetical protein
MDTDKNRAEENPNKRGDAKNAEERNVSDLPLRLSAFSAPLR